MRPLVLSALSLTVLLTGCDLFGGESAEAVAARREAEGKAVGSACRHAMRAIEDCYTLNPKTMKSAVFAGWREMDEYMRENKIEGVTPVIPRKSAKPAAAPASAPESEGPASGVDAHADPVDKVDAHAATPRQQTTH